jgi:hypothetical protein
VLGGLLSLLDQVLGSWFSPGLDLFVLFAGSAGRKFVSTDGFDEGIPWDLATAVEILMAS